MTAPGTLRRRRCHRAAGYSAASVFAAAALLAAGSAAFTQSKPSSAPVCACAGDNGGITLSPGFCATVFADNLGHARHMVFGPNGVLYVNTWSGRYYRNDTPPAGGFLVALKDSNGDFDRWRGSRAAGHHRRYPWRRRPRSRSGSRFVNESEAGGTSSAGKCRFQIPDITR